MVPGVKVTSLRPRCDSRRTPKRCNLQGARAQAEVQRDAKEGRMLVTHVSSQTHTHARAHAHTHTRTHISVSVSVSDSDSDYLVGLRCLTESGGLATIASLSLSFSLARACARRVLRQVAPQHPSGGQRKSGGRGKGRWHGPRHSNGPTINEMSLIETAPLSTRHCTTCHTRTVSSPLADTTFLPSGENPAEATGWV